MQRGVITERLSSLLLRNKSSLYILGKPLYHIRFANIFSHSVHYPYFSPIGSCFSFLVVVFVAQKFLILMNSGLSVFSLVACAFGVRSKKLSPNLRS